MQDGKKDGLGTYWWPTGASYKGEWSDGSMHGVGTFESPDGTRYQGGWARDLKQGLGKKWFPNGDTYEATCATDVCFGHFACMRLHWLCNMRMQKVLMLRSYHIHASCDVEQRPQSRALFLLSQIQQLIAACWRLGSLEGRQARRSRQIQMAQQE